MSEQIIIEPQAGKQKQACNIAVDFLIYGGARGAGKSYLLNMLPLKHIEDPKFRGIFFRRQHDEIMGAGGLWDTATSMYPQFGAHPNLSNLRWKFPSKAVLQMKHMYTEADKERHRGLQYSFVGFDEIDHFSKEQVIFLQTCLRSEAQNDSYMVGTCNPNPDSWVLDLVEWYLDDDGIPNPERSGTIRHYLTVGGDFVFADTSEELVEKYPELVYIENTKTGKVDFVRPKTFAFIAANIDDNPALVKANPVYKSELLSLPEHEKLRQYYGSWYARPTGANYFQRDWLVEVDTYPNKAKCCRAWDKAATQPSELNKNPDYTACSPRIYMFEGLYYLVFDVHDSIKDPKDNDKDISGRFRLRSGERDLLIKRQAQHDGTDCHVVFAVDPSASGKTEFESSSQKLTCEGMVVKKDPMPNNKSKLVRFEPFASACQNGLVRVVRSSFPNKATYDAFMKELEAFDGQPSTVSRKDDWPDATASAFNYISRMKTIKDFTIPTGTPTGKGGSLLSSFKKTLF